MPKPHLSRPSLLSGLIIGLLCLQQSGWAQNLNINGVTLDTRTGDTLGTLSSHGSMDEFTKLQKEMVLNVLKQLGIDPQTLPPHIRGQIEKPQTTNAQALSAFAKGLDLADKGQFKEAAAAFQEAAKNDPGFALASGMARLMPAFNLGSDPGSGANAMREMRQNANADGQQQANQQLDKMNQPGNNMDNLGLSDGSGQGAGDASLDPINLANNADDNAGGQQGFDNTNSRQIDTNDSRQNIDDVQHKAIETQQDENNFSNTNDFYGFAAGYREYCPDGCYADTPLASASSSSVHIHFRPDEKQVDASIAFAGDMLAGTTSPSVSISMTSTCDNSANGCDPGTNSPFSYYVSREMFSIVDIGDGNQYREINSGIEYFYDYGYGYDPYNSAPNQFSYSSWGYWYHWDGNYNLDEGYWVAGELTHTANIPNSGSAVYSGGMVGLTQDFHYVEGTMNWTVNFSNRTVSGSFDNITKDNLPWISSASVNGGWSSGQNAVSATISGTNISSGVANGAFFGPHAEELGGSWRIDHTNGDKASGIFLGKPGGTRFGDATYQNQNN